MDRNLIFPTDILNQSIIWYGTYTRQTWTVDILEAALNLFLDLPPERLDTALLGELGPGDTTSSLLFSHNRISSSW